MNLFVLFVLLSPVYSQYLADPNLAADSNFLANPNLLANLNLLGDPNLLADGGGAPSQAPPNPQNRPWEWISRNVLGTPCRYRSVCALEIILILLRIGHADPISQLIGTYTLEMDCQNDVSLAGVWSNGTSFCLAPPSALLLAASAQNSFRR